MTYAPTVQKVYRLLLFIALFDPSFIIFLRDITQPYTQCR